MQADSNDTNKQEVEAFFSKILEDPFNSVCYECGRKTRQWVDISLAIYLCLNCSALYKEASEDVKIKCINADPWSPEELRYLKNGGNRKLREFLSNYEMQTMTYKERLRTKAISYYRTLLQEEFNGREAPMAPDPVTGKQFAKAEKALTEMSKEEIFDEVKTKTLKVGAITYEYGSKAFTTVQQKITSGELKEGAVKVAEQVGASAKNFWDKVVLKFDQLTG